MAGVEVAGFVLGILPLIISAAEHYENVFRPFERYRKFAGELDLYQQQLGTQKTIFRNECRLLLATLTNRQTAKDMLKEGKHPSWEDPDLNERFSMQLRDSGVACKNIICLMEGKLKEVEEKTESFGSVIQQSIPLGSMGDKAWRLRIGKKLKFSLSESQLEKTLEDLRKLNQDFLILAKQTTKLDDTHQVSLLLRNPSPRTDKAVQDCTLVRKASAQLHQALERACQMHEEHSAHFRLESQHVIVEQQRFPLVRFNMAFSLCSTLEPVWIAVDSTFNEPPLGSMQKSTGKARQEAQDRLIELSNTLKRENCTPCDSSVKRIKGKTVHFDTTSLGNDRSTMMTRTKTRTKTTMITSLLADPALPNFCVQHDFCEQLQKYGPRTPVNKSIGYFEKSGSYKHLVYFAPPIITSTSGKSFSLAQIIHTMSSNSHAPQFLQHERLRLARQLSSAVLQFHATPILKDSWCSDDIVFFGTDALSTTLASPHLNVQVVKSHEHALKARAENSTMSKDDTFPFLRNPYLFGLGVILIELARQAPLSTFREQYELSNNYENKVSDYVIADRVSKSLAPSLGPNYAKVVRKCLGCDFGEGTTDLNDPGLQAAFYRDVVCKLERLEREFAKLYLGV